MDWASVSDFKQACTLRIIEIPRERHPLGDPGDVPGLGFTFGAITGMDAIVMELNGGTRKRPAFAIRVHSKRHRCASSEGGKEQVVGSWARVGATDTFGLVCA